MARRVASLPEVNYCTRPQGKAKSGGSAVVRDRPAAKHAYPARIRYDFGRYKVGPRMGLGASAVLTRLVCPVRRILSLPADLVFSCNT